jgi:hypothetical protein
LVAGDVNAAAEWPMTSDNDVRREARKAFVQIIMNPPPCLPACLPCRACCYLQFVSRVPNSAPNL